MASVVTASALERLYNAVSLARQAGAFASHHGPLEATAWLHVVIADLERLDDACGGVVTGDDGALAILVSLARHDPPLALRSPRRHIEARAARAARLEVVDSVALAVAAHVLASRGARSAEKADQLIAFAARRAAGLNLALEAANRFLAGWWSAGRLETQLHELNPFKVGGYRGNAASHDQHDQLHGGHENSHGDPDEHCGSSHAHDCRCIDHEPLTAAFAREWRALAKMSAAEARATVFPASPERSLYERVADRIDAQPRALTSARSVASPVTFDDRKPPDVEEHEDAGRVDLLVVPCTSLATTNEPLHVWVSMNGGTHRHDVDADVRSSAGGTVRVRVPALDGEALASLPGSSVPGVVRVTATGSLHDRPLESREVTIDVVAERPRCAPNEGGAWEIATVEAHQQVDACTPAARLEAAASRVRGQAGALLTGAYNAVVVGTQLCVQRAETRRCAQERRETVRRCTQTRDEGYNRCTQTRDDGYNRCTQTRDEGYRRCCDWVPCSWFCRAWVWVSNIVCVAWEWVKNIVCVAWEWVKNVVCTAWAWITNVVCVAWEVIEAVACIVASVVIGILKLILGLVLLAVAAGISTVAEVARLPCRLFGVGMRDEVSSTLKVVGVHSALLRTGKVLLMSYDEGVYPVDADHAADFSAIADSDRGLCAVWDPITGRADYTPSLRRNTFCAHQSFLADGRLFVNSGQFPLPGLLKNLLPPRLLAPGADKDVHVFDPITTTWTRLPDMQLGRWYPTCVTLPDGRVFVASGTNGWATSPGLGRGIQNTYEFADAAGQVGAPVKTPFLWFHLYPFAHLLPSGLVFTHSKRTTRLFDPNTGRWDRIAPVAGVNTAPGDTLWPYSRSGPGPGTSVLLPLRPEASVDGWVYPPGRVMILGGGGAEAAPEPEISGEPYNLRADTPATRTVEILDLGEREPRWRWSKQHMTNGRVMPDAVLLPDATVLVVGGGRYGKSGGLLAHFASVERGGEPDKGALDPVLEPELFNPETEAWRTLCRKPIGRLYHTTALLLADGRVLLAGHDGALNMKPHDRSRYELEIFSPPYLFRPDGSPAPRPAVTSAPEAIGYGEEFQVGIDGEVRDVALIRPGAVTHQINTDQRYVGLGFAANDENDRVVVTAPPNGSVAPPGYYLLFVVNTHGTPSVGRWIHLRR
jgi:Domain of unknown function (DUF1929)